MTDITPPDHCPLCGHELNSAGLLVVDTRHGIATCGGRAAKFSPTNIRIIAELQSAMPGIVTTEHLLRVTHAATRKSLHTNINRMRPNLEYLFHRIESVNQRGYHLVPL